MSSWLPGRGSPAFMLSSPWAAQLIYSPTGMATPVPSAAALPCFPTSASSPALSTDDWQSQPGCKGLRQQRPPQDDSRGGEGRRGKRIPQRAKPDSGPPLPRPGYCVKKGKSTGPGCPRDPEETRKTKKAMGPGSWATGHRAWAMGRVRAMGY